jgi:hypothetical protein
MTKGKNKYFTSKVLSSAGVKHAFLGRFSNPDELNKAALDIFGHSAEDIITINQVHGNCVIVLKAPLKENSYYKEIAGDAIVTALGDQPIAIRSADCLPVLLYDEKNSVIGAAHAGWRSTLEQVAVKTVEAMGENFGSNPKDIKAACGPYIGPCCYTVKPELVEKFKEAGHKTGSFLISDNCTRLDLALANLDQLISAGVREDNISSEAPCTSCNTEHYYSYRVEGESAGRELSIIMTGEKN